MAKVTNSLTHATPVGVEHSDERLAAVEEAKRTGGEFQSVGAKGHDIVDRETLREEVEKVSNEGSTDKNQPLPDYLVQLQEGVDNTIELNQRKANEHNEYSREIAKAQQEAEVADREKLRKDPDYFARRIAENNRRLADAHNSKAAEYARQSAETNEGKMEEVRALRPESVTDPDPITALGKKSKVTDISESFASGELKEKDRIIYGEDSYKKQAKAPRKIAPDDERALDADLTDEPKRIEEPTREVDGKGEPADSPVIDGSADLAEPNSEANEFKPKSAGGSSDEDDDKPKRRSSKKNDDKE